MFKHLKYHSLPLIVLIGFSGCASFSSMNERAKIKPVTDYKTSKSYEANVTSWPTESWWKSYQDEQLNTLVQSGLKNSPDMAVVSARIAQAGAYVKMSASQLSPQVGVNAAVSSEKLSYNYITPGAFTPHGWRDYGQAGIGVSWEIDFWGKNKAALATATSEYDAALAEQAQARLSLAAAIATNYSQLAQLYAVRDSVAGTIDVRKNGLKLFEQRYKNGLENKVSVSDAKARLSGAEYELLAIDEQISLVKNQLAVLIGEGPDYGAEIKRPSINLQNSFELPPELAVNLLGRRPDITAAKLQVEARESRIKNKQAAFYPNVNLSALIGLQSLGLDKLTNAGSDIGSVGPAIYLPIFTGGRLEADLKAAESSYDEAVANYNRTVTHALGEVANVGISQKMLTSQIKTAQDGVNYANEAYEVASNRYKQGVSNYIEVLYASDSLFAAQKNLASLKARSLILDIAMKRALGGGYLVVKNN